MAQISMVKYSDIKEAGRFDAEYFKPEYLEIEKKLKDIKTYLVKDIFEPIKNGVDYRKFVKKGNRKYIRTADIKEYGYTWTAVDINLNEIPKKIRLKIEDILFTRKGNFGKNCIVDNNVLKESLISSEIMLLRKKENINFNVYYLSIFLRSYFGEKQIFRNIHGVSNFSITQEALENLKIPILPKIFQKEIEDMVKTAHKKLEESKKLYKEAEELLLKELGLLSYKPKHKLTFETTKSKVDEAGRFDAEYFQPKYEEIIKKIENYKEGFDIVEEVLNIKDKNFTPKKDKKYKYIELSNIGNNGEITDCTEDLGVNLPTRARRKVVENDIIISSIEGSLNSIALITKEYSDSLCSTGFYVVHSKKINPETLLVLAKSYAMQSQLKRGCKGTILTAIPKYELNKIKIPLINQTIQKQIANKIKESFKLRKESKELLEKAKKMVEEEIEKEVKK